MKTIKVALIVASFGVGLPAVFAQTMVHSEGSRAAQSAQGAEAIRVDRGPATPKSPDLVLTPAELRALYGERGGTSNDADAPPRLVQPVVSEAQPPRAGDWPDNGGPVRISLLDTLMKLGVVVILLSGCLHLFRSLAQRRRPPGDVCGTTLCILQTVRMGGSKALHIVEAGPHTLLIADSGSRIAILADLAPHPEPTRAIPAEPSRSIRPAAPPARAQQPALSAAGPRGAELLEWEDKPPVPDVWPTEPDATVPRPQRSRAGATRRAVPNSSRSGSSDHSEDGPDPDSPGATGSEQSRTIRSRRALLLRALRSKEEARREPAIEHNDRF